MTVRYLWSYALIVAAIVIAAATMSAEDTARLLYAWHGIRDTYYDIADWFGVRTCWEWILYAGLAFQAFLVFVGYMVHRDPHRAMRRRIEKLRRDRH
jgi:hypothetical protein